MARKIKIGCDEYVTNPGSRLVPRYVPVIDKSGHMELEVSGYDDIQEMIESYAESTDIRSILARVKAGEVDLLEKTKGVFGDFTGSPKTLAEALQLQIDSGRLFDSLTPEVKSRFNNDPNEFFAQAGNNEWFERIGYPEQMRSMNNTPPAQSEKAAETPTTE